MNVSAGCWIIIGFLLFIVLADGIAKWKRGRRAVDEHARGTRGGPAVQKRTGNDAVRSSEARTLPVPHEERSFPIGFCVVRLKRDRTANLNRITWSHFCRWQHDLSVRNRSSRWFRITEQFEDRGSDPIGLT